MALPDAKDELIRLYTFNDSDLSLIRQHRDSANRQGFVVQLFYMRYPGILLAADAEPDAPLLRMVADQLKPPGDISDDYGQRAETELEHPLELQSADGFQSFTTLSHYRAAVHSLDDLVWQTDKGIVLARELADGLHHKNVLLPAVGVMERICAEAITRANRRIHAALTDTLTSVHHQRLDELLKRKEGSKATWLVWLRQLVIAAITAMASAMHYYNTCRRWAGSTSIWPAITSGAAAPSAVRGSAGRYSRF